MITERSLLFEQDSIISTEPCENVLSKDELAFVDSKLWRKKSAQINNISEMDVVRHYTRLSQLNYSIDTQFYPLGSCTMKYNPKICHRLAMQSDWLEQHPQAPAQSQQGLLQWLYELQQMLASMTGMKAVCLSPMAGAQGEFAGIAMIRAYHQQRQDSARTEILVPDAAHGTNPASAVMCGYKVTEIPTKADGDLDIEALKQLVGPQTAGIMLTNPSTLGVFERQIEQIAKIIHQAGGLLYYDGANLNAILAKVRPGDMGFDVIHINAHKTFATPHGTGGPGAGPIAVSERLAEFLPVPIVAKNEQQYYWLDESERPLSIGRLSQFSGNISILLRAYIYCRLLGSKGMVRVAENATLHANYLQKRLQQAGFELAFPERRATHEFIMSFRQELKEHNVSAKDIAKRLLDFGVHAPTTYFPMLVAECFLIEPSETESKQTLDNFVDILSQIKQEIETNPDVLHQAPHHLPVNRIDEVKAAKDLDLNYFSD